mgnify:CR=1 FL=1
MGDICGMNSGIYDDKGNDIGSSNSENYKLIVELESMGIRRDAVEFFLKIIPKEKIDDVIKIIGKWAGLEKR